MQLILDSTQFRQFAKDMLDVGRIDLAVQLGLVKDKISQRQAYKRFGETRVNTWEQRKLIESVKEKGNTSTRYYSLIQLTILDKGESYEK